MKDKIYLVSLNLIEEKVRMVFEMPGEIGFIARFGLLSCLREQEIIYIKENEICGNGYDCDCDSLHKVDCKNGLTIVAIGWTRVNKKALATTIIQQNIGKSLEHCKNLTILISLLHTKNNEKRCWHCIYCNEKNSL